MVIVQFSEHLLKLTDGFEFLVQSSPVRWKEQLQRVAEPFRLDPKLMQLIGRPLAISRLAASLEILLHQLGQNAAGVFDYATCGFPLHTLRSDRPLRHLAEKSRALQRRTISENSR